MELFKKTLLVAVLGLVVVDASAMKRTHEQAEALSFVAQQVRPGVFTLGIAEADNVVWGDIEYSRNAQGQWVYADGRAVTGNDELNALRQMEPLVNRVIRTARRQAGQAVNYVATHPNVATAVVAGAARAVLAGTPVNTGDALGLVVETGLVAVTGSFVARQVGSAYQWTAAQVATAKAFVNYWIDAHQAAKELPDFSGAVKSAFDDLQ